MPHMQVCPQTPTPTRTAEAMTTHSQHVPGAPGIAPGASSAPSKPDPHPKSRERPYKRGGTLATSVSFDASSLETLACLEGRWSLKRSAVLRRLLQDAERRWLRGKA
jgi:hypothetical protein